MQKCVDVKCTANPVVELGVQLSRPVCTKLWVQSPALHEQGVVVHLGDRGRRVRSSRSASVP